MQLAEMIADPQSDEITCLCGNTPAADGFYPFANGHEVEPDDSWDGVTMFCAACFRTFDQTTGVVLSRETSIGFLN